MSFQIALDKYERAYGALARAVQAALQATFTEEARDRGLTQADVARELNISPSVVSRKLNGSGNATLRSVSDLFTAMGREPLSGFHPPPGKYERTPDAMLIMGSQNIPTILFVSSQNDGRETRSLVTSFNMFDSGYSKQFSSFGNVAALPGKVVFTYDPGMARIPFSGNP